MDLALDWEKSATLKCETCDAGLQKLRNCNGKGGPAIIQLNKELYKQCPRALSFNKQESSYLVSLYFDCRENNILPMPGSFINQTSFCKELFDYLDIIVFDYRARKQKEESDRIDKANAKIDGK